MNSTSTHTLSPKKSRLWTFALLALAATLLTDLQMVVATVGEFALENLYRHPSDGNTIGMIGGGTVHTSNGTLIFHAVIAVLGIAKYLFVFLAYRAEKSGKNKTAACFHTVSVGIIITTGVYCVKVLYDALKVYTSITNDISYISKIMAINKSVLVLSALLTIGVLITAAALFAVLAVKTGIKKPTIVPTAPSEDGQTESAVFDAEDNSDIT